MSTEQPATNDRPAEMAALLGKVALGDRSAFERLYRMTAPNLYAQLNRMLRRSGWADDDEHLR